MIDTIVITLSAIVGSCLGAWLGLKSILKDMEKKGIL